MLHRSCVGPLLYSESPQRDRVSAYLQINSEHIIDLDFISRYWEDIYWETHLSIPAGT